MYMIFSNINIYDILLVVF